MKDELTGSIFMTIDTVRNMDKTIVQVTLHDGKMLKGNILFRHNPRTFKLSTPLFKMKVLPTIVDDHVSSFIVDWSQLGKLLL